MKTEKTITGDVVFNIRLYGGGELTQLIDRLCMYGLCLHLYFLSGGSALCLTSCAGAKSNE